jgi:hypothetical protein
METKLYKPIEIANILQCHPKTVRLKMRTGQLPCTEIAGQRYMTGVQLEKLINSGEKIKFEKPV